MGANKVTDFGLKMYEDKYFLPGETYDDLVKRVCDFNSLDEEHSKRLQEYWKKLWFHPATPITANSGTNRGHVISCFLNEVKDSKGGIFSGYDENFWLGAGGGGIGTDWSSVREVGASVGTNGKSSGIIPFLKVSDSATLAVSQGGLRRASQAVYLNVDHPEIEEFIDLRRPTGADANRRCLNIHHGVKLDDEFMTAVFNRDRWNLISPATGNVVKDVDAFDLFKKILLSRVETGEPYIFFSDNALEQQPTVYDEAGLEVSMSNLCTEIMLPTSPDRTAVCCLSSLNLETYDEWQDHPEFIYDVVAFLDKVLSNFIEMASGELGYEKAVASAKDERSIGLGVMGLAGLMQSMGVPWESAIATSLNRKIFRHIREKVDLATEELAIRLGAAPIYDRVNSEGKPRRNVCAISIAPTSSISILCGESTAGVDPILTNVYTHKNNVGSHVVRNKHLVAVIDTFAREKHLKGDWVEAQWKSIIQHEGSVQHLEWMDEWTKEVFKTAYEINQLWIIEGAATRQEFIDQGQSVNLFFAHDSHVAEIYNTHFSAWSKGLKSLYYCRSTTSNRAKVGHKVERDIIKEQNYEECLSCQ